MNIFYSFMDVHSELIGKTGAINLSSSGISEEGLVFEPVNDNVSQFIGVEGGVVYGLNSSNAHKIYINVLKDSIAYTALQHEQALSVSVSALVGAMVLNLTNNITKEKYIFTGVAFIKSPRVAFGRKLENVVFELLSSTMVYFPPITE